MRGKNEWGNSILSIRDEPAYLCSLYNEWQTIDAFVLLIDEMRQDCEISFTMELKVTNALVEGTR